jgi:hypothetical protein
LLATTLYQGNPVKILGYVRSDKFKIAPHKQKSIVKKIIGGKIGKPL